MTDIEIIDKYPKVFGTRPFDCSVSAMDDGFRCGDGWFPMLDELFGKMNDVVERKNLSIQVVQVKSKFGDLCVFYEGNYKEINDLISEYYEIASKTCEECGKPGNMWDRGMGSYVVCKDCKNNK